MYSILQFNVPVLQGILEKVLLLQESLKNHSLTKVNNIFNGFSYFQKVGSELILGLNFYFTDAQCKRNGEMHCRLFLFMMTCVILILAVDLKFSDRCSGSFCVYHGCKYDTTRARRNLEYYIFNRIEPYVFVIKQSKKRFSTSVVFIE